MLTSARQSQTQHQTTSARGSSASTAAVQLKSQLRGKGFDEQVQMLAPKGQSAPGETPQATTRTTAAAGASDKAGGPPVKRVVGTLIINIMCHKDEYRFTQSQPTLALTWAMPKNEPGVVYEDYFDVRVYQQVPSPDGSSYTTVDDTQPGRLSMAELAELMPGAVHSEEKYNPRPTGTPAMIIEIMRRVNPLFNIVDNAALGEDMLTGEPRTGRERGTAIVTNTVDLIALGGTGKAGQVARAAYYSAAAADLMAEQGWIPRWVGSLIQTLAGLTAIQKSAVEFLEKNASGLVAMIQAAVKDMSALEKAADGVKVCKAVLEPMLALGVSNQELSEEDKEQIMESASTVSIVLDVATTAAGLGGG